MFYTFLYFRYACTYTYCSENESEGGHEHDEFDDSDAEDDWSYTEEDTPNDLNDPNSTATSDTAHYFLNSSVTKLHNVRAGQFSQCTC